MLERIKLQGREAQCPICNEVFTSDAMCELHKLYGPKGQRGKGHQFARADCVYPATIGMVVKEKRGHQFWTKPIPEETKWWPKAEVPEEGAPPKVQSLTCLTCGIVWERPAQRGRPPRFCVKCKEAQD